MRPSQAAALWAAAMVYLLARVMEAPVPVALVIAGVCAVLVETVFINPDPPCRA
jgi:hypothetical protein